MLCASGRWISQASARGVRFVKIWVDDRRGLPALPRLILLLIFATSSIIAGGAGWSVAGARLVEVPVQMRDRQGGISSINTSRAFYYMLEVTLGTLFVYIRLVNKRP